MAQNALAIFDYSYQDLKGPIAIVNGNVETRFIVLYRDTVANKSALIGNVVTSFPSTATGPEVVTAMTTAIVDRGTAEGFTVPRASVRFPAFSIGQ